MRVAAALSLRETFRFRERYQAPAQSLAYEARLR